MEIQELKSSSKLVFLAIAKYYSVNRSCYPPPQTLCEDYSMTINTVKTAINELVNNKIIKIEKIVIYPPLPPKGKLWKEKIKMIKFLKIQKMIS